VYGIDSLGDGTRTSSTTPVQVSGLTDVAAIAGNTALKTDGTVWKWGNNQYGQLGIASTESCPDLDMGVFYFPCSTTPVPVVMPMDGAYSVGGTVSGLADGETIVLQNNGGDDLTITLNGDFSFDTPVISAETYDITILTQPYSQTCLISSGSGRVGADVTTISVTCYDLASVGGTVSGLVDGETLVLQNNGGDDLTITTNGDFSFATELEYLTDYNVTILTQPSGQFCNVSNGSGTILDVEVEITNVEIACF